MCLWSYTIEIWSHKQLLRSVWPLISEVVLLINGSFIERVVADFQDSFRMDVSFLKCAYTPFIFHLDPYRCWIPGAVQKTLSPEAVSLWTATQTGEKQTAPAPLRSNIDS